MFYLTVDDLFAFVDGRSVTNNLRGLINLRRAETDEYRKVSLLCVSVDYNNILFVSRACRHQRDS